MLKWFADRFCNVVFLVTLFILSKPFVGRGKQYPSIFFTRFSSVKRKTESIPVHLLLKQAKLF